MSEGHSSAIYSPQVRHWGAQQPQRYQSSLGWRPYEWAAESGQIKASIGPYLERRVRERGTFVVGRTFPTRFDKAVRAQSIRGRMALYGLYVPARASWYPAFRSELLSFPAGKHDDQVDALGLIGQLLDTMRPGSELPRPKVQEPIRSLITVDELLQLAAPVRMRV